MMLFISSIDISVVSEPEAPDQKFLWIPASDADAAAVNLNGTNTLRVKKSEYFFIAEINDREKMSKIT